MTGFPKRTPYRNQRLLDAAKGQPCTMNSPVCSGDSSTVVFCHLNESFAGKGGGQKADDFAGFDGCARCHWWYDEGHADEETKRFYAFRAVTRTIRNRLDRKILK